MSLLSQRLHPLTGEGFAWSLYQGFDVDASADFTVHDEGLLSAVENHKAFTGDVPNICLDECFEDPSCHGFVTYEGTCYFRGGGAETPSQLVDAKARASLLSTSPDVKLCEHVT